MSCRVAAAQTGSYFGSPQAGRGSAWISTCDISGCPAQYSISRAASCGVSMADAIEPR